MHDRNQYWIDDRIASISVENVTAALGGGAAVSGSSFDTTEARRRPDSCIEIWQDSDFAGAGDEAEWSLPGAGDAQRDRDESAGAAGGDEQSGVRDGKGQPIELGAEYYLRVPGKQPDARARPRHSNHREQVEL